MAKAATPDGVLLLDKPAGITSTRALAMAKRALRASKAGHTGTLDPFATGLLPLVFGEATKFSRFLIDSTKAYRATLRLGWETESGDPETPARAVSTEVPTSSRIAEVLCKFEGDIDQLPPMHSAVHVAGRRLYEYAREGVEVARELRQVHVSKVEMVALTADELTVDVRCSKGTYIRVLAADIGRTLGCGAYLTALRRTAVGQFSLTAATALETLQQSGPEAARGMLLPPDILVAELPRIALDPEKALRFGHGQWVDVEGTVAAPIAAVFAPDQAFVGVATVEGSRIVPLRLLADRQKFPDFA